MSYVAAQLSLRSDTMARPRKVSYESICEHYKEARRQNVRYPVSATAKTFGVSTRTVNRALIKAVHQGLIAEELADLPIFKPKQVIPASSYDLQIAWT